jgi:hypothetical protein
VEVHGVCFLGGGREGEDGGLKCKTIAMRGLKVLLNIGGCGWAKRLTILIGPFINLCLTLPGLGPVATSSLQRPMPPQFYFSYRD